MFVFQSANAARFIWTCPAIFRDFNRTKTGRAHGAFPDSNNHPLSAGADEPFRAHEQKNRASVFRYWEDRAAIAVVKCFLGLESLEPLDKAASGQVEVSWFARDDQGNPVSVPATERHAVGGSGHMFPILVPLALLPRRFSITATLTASNAWSSLSVHQTICAHSHQYFLGIQCGANELVQFFDTHSEPTIVKSTQYFPIYHRHLDRFRSQREVVFLEIGVGGGGAHTMWRKYFSVRGAIFRYFAIDINTRAPELVGKGGTVFVGDQGDAAFLERVAGEVPRADVILDDGSHFARHQIQSFQAFFPQVLKNGGVYLCEDLETAGTAWQTDPAERSFIDYARDLAAGTSLFPRPGDHADALQGIMPGPLSGGSVAGVSFYAGIIVIEKSLQFPLDISTAWSNAFAQDKKMGW